MSKLTSGLNHKYFFTKNSKFSFIIRLNIPEKYLEYFNICSFACVHRYSIYTWLDISKVKVEKLRHLKIFKSFAPYRTVVLDQRYKDYGKTLRKCNAAAIIRYTFYIKLFIMDLFHYNIIFLTHFWKYFSSGPYPNQSLVIIQNRIVIK